MCCWWSTITVILIAYVFRDEIARSQRGENVKLQTKLKRKMFTCMYTTCTVSPMSKEWATTPCLWLITLEFFVHNLFPGARHSNSSMIPSVADVDHHGNCQQRSWHGNTQWDASNTTVMARVPRILPAVVGLLLQWVAWMLLVIQVNVKNSIRFFVIRNFADGIKADRSWVAKFGIESCTHCAILFRLEGLSQLRKQLLDGDVIPSGLSGQISIVPTTGIVNGFHHFGFNYMLSDRGNILQRTEAHTAHNDSVIGRAIVRPLCPVLFKLCPWQLGSKTPSNGRKN